MAQSEEDIIILSGHGYDKLGPYLLVNHVHAKTQERLHIWNTTFSMTKLPRKFCTGWFDFKTYASHACDNEQEMLGDSKFTDCSVCQEKTGFNPAFYNAETISAQQREYNQTPHFVYMAYFAPDFLKVGISSETRGLERLLEQGARAAAVMGRFPNADEARELEAYLCSQEGIFETMRASKKTELFAETVFNYEEAKKTLEKKAAEFDITPEIYWDFTPYYFGGLAPKAGTIHVAPNASDTVCGGRCIGLIGTTIVFQQNGENFPIDLKSWKGHAIQFDLNQVLIEYEASDTQMFLC